MESKKAKGKKGELLAIEYYQDRGYSLVDRNWRWGRGEIDLIVQRESILVFVEVKFRSSFRFGYFDEILTASQLNSILECSEHYYSSSKIKYKSFRIDYLCILPDKKGRCGYEYYLQEDIAF